MTDEHYQPLDPQSPEGKIHKAMHDLGQQCKKFNTLSEWLANEYARNLEGKPWLKTFEPRKIATPGGYHSPKNVSGGLSAFFANVGMEEAIGIPVLQTEVTAHAILYEIIRYKVPIYYVADAFIRAVAATELPKDFTLHDLHWPMPGMVLGFPIKFMQEYLGRDVCYLFCADLAEGDHAAPRELATLPFVGTCPTVVTSSKVGIMFNTSAKGDLGSYVSAYHKADRVDEAIQKYSYTDYTYADAAVAADDDRVTRLVTMLVFKLLVVLNTRPTLVEPGPIARTEKRHPKTGEVTRTEMWNANIIGAKYRVVRGPSPGTGTHASPKWHWRRGHLTHVRIGSLKSPDFVSIAALPRREDGEVDWLKVPEETRQAFWRSHKRTWLEPTLINFEEADGK